MRRKEPVSSVMLTTESMTFSQASAINWFVFLRGESALILGIRRDVASPAEIRPFYTAKAGKQ